MKHLTGIQQLASRIGLTQLAIGTLFGAAVTTVIFANEYIDESRDRAAPEQPTFSLTPKGEIYEGKH